MNEPVTLDLQVLTIVLGTLIPLLVGLLTKLMAPSWLKAVLNAFLSATAGTIAQIIDAGGTFSLREAVVATAVTWVISVATYYGLWKPTGTAPAVQQSTAQFGLTAGSRTRT